MGKELVRVYINDPLSKAASMDLVGAYTLDLGISGGCQRKDTSGVVRINERGQLCERLPPLAHTCRQILGEMWGLCFSPPIGTTPNHPMFTAKVKNFDFFPLFRLLQMLRHLPRRVDVNGQMINIVLENDGFADATSKTRYEKIRKLTQLHWLHGLPILGSLMGVRGAEDLSAKPIQEAEAKREFWR